MHPWHDLEFGKSLAEVNVFVETPKGSTGKFEISKRTGKIKLDRKLSFRVPAAYGFIPKTLNEDGDPLDVMLLTALRVKAGDVLLARPVALLRVLDTGKHDEKVLAIPLKDRRFRKIKGLKNIPIPTLDRIERFFKRYKQGIEIMGWLARPAAGAEIKQCLKAYRYKFRMLR